MWGAGKRTSLFVVSYGPLAAMFMVLHWPIGWPAGDLIRLGAWLFAIATLIVLPIAALSLTGRTAKALMAAAFLIAAILVTAGIARGWLHPMAMDQSKPQTQATSAGIAFGFCAIAVLLVATILHSATRVSAPNLPITDPRDQGGAVAGYLAAYLLPLLSIDGGGWRITAAYAIYLMTVYVVFIRSDNLVLVNPTLYIFGYRIFDVEVDSKDPGNRRRVLLLTKQKILPTTKRVAALPLGDDSYVAAQES
jgi:hypothetical protein